MRATRVRTRWVVRRLNAYAARSGLRTRLSHIWNFVWIKHREEMSASAWWLGAAAVLLVSSGAILAALALHLPALQPSQQTQLGLKPHRLWQHEPHGPWRAEALRSAHEARPPVGADIEFTRAHLRYCMFQQARLEAVRPPTRETDLIHYGIFVNDWNLRCAHHRALRADREAVAAELAAHREDLEVEGRRLMKDAYGMALPGREAHAAVLKDVSFPARQAEGTAKPSIVLPTLITEGVSREIEPPPAYKSWLASPSLRLLNADAAALVQKRLKKLGYFTHMADGVWGPASRAALRAFKKANGLLWDDAFDAETAVRMFSIMAVQAPAKKTKHIANVVAAPESVYPAPFAARMNPLNRADCMEIQTRLAALGFYSGAVNGLWGMGSRTALRNFKIANGLSDDDEWDDVTETALNDPRAAPKAENFAGRWPDDLKSCQTSIAADDGVRIEIAVQSLQGESQNCDLAILRKLANMQ